MLLHFVLRGIRGKSAFRSIARIYCALAVFAAVLLSGLSVARTPIRGFVASITIEQRVARGDAEAALPVSAAELLQAVSDGAPARRIRSVARLDPAENEALAERLQVSVGEGGSPWNSPVTVHGRAATRPQALRLVRRTAQEIATGLDDLSGREAARRGERFARWQLRELRHYETRARDALESFLADWQPEPQEVADSDSGEAQASGVPTETVRETWSRLRDQYEQAVARREQAERDNEEALHQLVAATRNVRSWQFTPPTIVRQLGGDVPRARFGLVLVLATCAATGMFWLSGRPGRAAVLQSVEEVEAATDLPALVGPRPDELAAHREQDPAFSRWVWAGVLTAETIVAAFLIAFEIDLCLERSLLMETVVSTWDLPGALLMRNTGA